MAVTKFNDCCCTFYYNKAHTVHSNDVMIMPSGVIVIGSGIVTEIESGIGTGIATVIVVVKENVVTLVALMMKRNAARSHDARVW